MHIKTTLVPVALILLTISLTNSTLLAQTPPDVTAKAVAAAEKLIGTLDKEQQAKLQFSFDDEQQRRRWSNLPTGIVARAGLRMGDLNETQQAAVFGLLEATLSERGVQQVRDNMASDELLKTGDRPGRIIFGKDEYYVSILGKPSTTAPWMWQFGGHHLGINATIVGEQITLAPSLTGGQPVEYTLSGKKVHQLAGDKEKSFALLKSLTAEQRLAAVLSDNMADMMYGPGKDATIAKVEGLSASKLDEAQKKLLLELVEERIGLLNTSIAEKQMKDIAKDVDQISFAWFGPTDVGAAASYRIVGPTVVIEYCPQRMGGSAHQHLHAMLRDPTNDYGSKAVREQKGTQK